MSQKRYGKSLFIFRRDLRLEDNTGLNEALKHSEEVIPAFIFTPAQIRNNPYRSDHALEFLINSLKALDTSLEKKGGRLYIFYGEPETVVESLHQEQGIDAVFINEDYTPYSRERDEKIKNSCISFSLGFHSHEDLLLTSPREVTKGDGKPYTIFTPFSRKAMLFPVPECASLAGNHFTKKEISLAYEPFPLYKDILNTSNPHLFRKGGRREALEILENLSFLKNYGNERDIPARQGTSGLSAHHKFGTISVRETFWAAREHFELTHPFISQLYWRDFFHHIAFHFPKVFGHAFQEKFENVEWDEDEERFSAWCEGRTGFPIVDAAMRELNTTGYMHNRCRMIVASFLVKDLLLDWRKGERYFATQLVDYDPCVNNGSWQWAASTGCDAQPYFRIFNPWRQQIRFDPDAEYIKKWVPELKDLDPKTIHRLNEQRPLILQEYPRPIVNHRTMAEEAKSRYKQAS